MSNLQRNFNIITVSSPEEYIAAFCDGYHFQSIVMDSSLNTELFRLLKEQYEAGCDEAHSYLYLLCLVSGLGCAEDVEAMVEPMRRLAEQGLDVAQNTMGGLYYAGQSVEKDFTLSLQYYEQSAAQGYPVAIYNLGLCYLNGNGIEQNFTQAEKLFLDASNQGYARAKGALARLYLNDKCGLYDEQKAIDFLKQAADAQERVSAFQLADYYRNGVFVEKDMSKAIQYYTIAATKGYLEAQKYLGKYYKDVQAKTSNSVQGINNSVMWLTAAAEQGDADSMVELAEVYNGNGAQKDCAKAFSYYFAAAEKQHVEATFQLGVCYRDGVGTEVNSAKAAEYFGRAAVMGHNNARNDLAVLYEKGEGVKRSQVHSTKLFMEAANSGHSIAQQNLAGKYARGEGVPRSNEMAAYWYARAVEGGWLDARNAAIEHYLTTGAGEKAVILKYINAIIESAHEPKKLVAKRQLAELLLHYTELEQCHEEAVTILQELMSAKNPPEQGKVMFLLGECYELGHGVPQSFGWAFDLWNRAATYYYDKSAVLALKRYF